MSTFKYVHSAIVVSEHKREKLNLLVEGNRIVKVSESTLSDFPLDTEIIDASGLYLLPGIIDSHVHFREPGLTDKADMTTESKAAVASGVTTVLEMPNTSPATTSLEALEEKISLAKGKMLCNYGFFYGITNQNVQEALSLPKGLACGLKLFLGSSTGNMLVDKQDVLQELFSKSKLVISAHCEDEARIKFNTERYKKEYGDDAPVTIHPMVRDAEACYLSSKFAIELAKKTNARLNIAHLTTAKEVGLLDKGGDIKNKKITSEVSPTHLWFSQEDFMQLGNKIKCNPSIKTKEDRDALRKALNDDKIDIIATDHAPHLLQEKETSYFYAPSGMPSIQHSLQIMLELVREGVLGLEKLVEKMSNNPAILFDIKERGFIKEGYFADFVLVDLDSTQKVLREDLFYKCGWSPLEGQVFHSKVVSTFVNGQMIYHNGEIISDIKGMKI